MKGTSAALLAHFAQKLDAQTVARCWRVQRKDGTIARFTDNVTDLVISGWVAPADIFNGTYSTAVGFKATDLRHSSGLNVDGMDVQGPQVAPGILEADVHAGLWDRARYRIFLVNYADLTMGPHRLSAGWLGELGTGVGDITVELRNLMQAYSQTVVMLVAPGCANNFGDTRCGVALGPLTVTGTLTRISPDGMTLYDTSRTEPGPTAGVAITGATNANPCVITMADGSLNLQEGQPVTISGIVGMPLLNVVTVAKNPSGSTFELSIDTTDTATYGTYSSGGTVTPLGGGRSIYDGGKITFTSGPNAGFSQDVKAYAPGQITLMLPMPYPLAIGNTYSLVQGCGKQFLANCVGEHSNGDRFRGFPWLAGIDKMIQVGRHQ